MSHETTQVPDVIQTRAARWRLGPVRHDNRPYGEALFILVDELGDKTEFRGVYLAERNTIHHASGAVLSNCPPENVLWFLEIPPLPILRRKSSIKRMCAIHRRADRTGK